ncbi:LacI family transcriptional regulator [Algimonas ampicilliniresistens]|uniref:LacI family transcriptional regulator n=1 Tax=Algimonas ampicilliniresistens TaxID=1298735 RepID=A0ABQ5V9A1_9PROT|nr:LacI family DNA-binding transcriptional regulator [Algimonas ampicilliniresistens]GLQ23166.1 LacI family transcriptional regulator [Algimonas ampicilliniresistens]
MKATITDVAKQAGVSMKTVSRVLNNEPNVAKATRDRVMEVAASLQYRPNLAARGLASSKSYLIALLYDNASASYITNIQRGAIEACRRNGYHLLLEPMPYEQANSPEAEILLGRLGVDGVILTPPLSDSVVLRDILRRLDMRHVAVAPNKMDDVHAVRMDDAEAAFQMTTYLIEQGHRDIGFILGHPNHGATASRRLGFEKALNEAGIKLNEDWISAGDFSFRSGVQAAEHLLSNPDNRPTAIFASNDDMAAGVMSVAGRLGISVPEALSVCGFDDTPIAQIIWPQLTTVAQPIHKMGFKAASILISRDNPDDPKICTLDFELIIRESTLGGPLLK